MEKSDGYTSRRSATLRRCFWNGETLLIPGRRRSRETSTDNDGDLNAQWKTARYGWHMKIRATSDTFSRARSPRNPEKTNWCFMQHCGCILSRGVTDLFRTTRGSNDVKNFRRVRVNENPNETNVDLVCLPNYLALYRKYYMPFILFEKYISQTSLSRVIIRALRKISRVTFSFTINQTLVRYLR